MVGTRTQTRSSGSDAFFAAVSSFAAAKKTFSAQCQSSKPKAARSLSPMTGSSPLWVRAAPKRFLVRLAPKHRGAFGVMKAPKHRGASGVMKAPKQCALSGFVPPTPQFPREKKRRALGRCALRGRQGSTALRLSPIGTPATLAPSPRLSSARWGAPSHAKRKASVRLPEFCFITAKHKAFEEAPSPIFSVQNTKLSVEQPKSPLHSSARRSRADGRVLRAQRARRGCRDCPKNKHSSANEVKRMVVFIFQRAKR